MGSEHMKNSADSVEGVYGRVSEAALLPKCRHPSARSSHGNPTLSDCGLCKKGTEKESVRIERRQHQNALPVNSEVRNLSPLTSATASARMARETV